MSEKAFRIKKLSERLLTEISLKSFFYATKKTIVSPQKKSLETDGDIFSAPKNLFCPNKDRPGKIG